MSQISVGSVQLKRRLGVVHGIGVICGLIIGSGIFVSPKGVLVYSRSPGLSLILWVVGGVIETTGALSYAELATTYPTSGELYEYLNQLYGATLGPPISFLYLWCYSTLMRSGANAIKCLTFAYYVLKPAYPDCDIPVRNVVLVAVLLSRE